MKFLSVVFTTALLIISGCDRSPSDTDSSQNLLPHRLRAKVQVLNPANVGDAVSDAVASDIFECLYQYHYLKRPYELIPQLAADMPEVSGDGLTYTIKINRELKASDFVFAWKRIKRLRAGLLRL